MKKKINEQNVVSYICSFRAGFLNLGSAATFLGFRGKIKKIKNILAQMEKKRRINKVLSRYDKIYACVLN